jgi:thymidylate synthase (FAD)
MVDIPLSVRHTNFDEYYSGDSGADADELAHFAGRSCYQAWDMPNPATANDMGYLANILKQQHYSVLEHGSATFYIEGVSRALLTELTRHRHLQFSVESQRYVDYSKTKPVYPPMADAMTRAQLDTAYSSALDSYNKAVEHYRDAGLTRKEAREAARALLPNAAPVSMVVTGNHRAWREVIQKRISPSADKEIQMLAVELLDRLKAIAPGCYQDM